MEAIRKIIDSNLLNGVVALPEKLKNRKVEIIIFAAEEKSPKPSFLNINFDKLLKGSVTESLIGALLVDGNSEIKTLEEYRSERILSKYERID